MDKLIEENIAFRKLNENDMGLFINLRLDFFMDYYNIEEPEKKQIENEIWNLQIQLEHFSKQKKLILKYYL
jgi:hypothetical protein